MSDNPAANDLPPEVKILVQYVKDLTFENPSAPGVFLQPASAPDVEMNVGLLSRRQDGEDEVYETVLKASAQARDGSGRVLFVVEVVYGSLVQLHNVPEELFEQALYVEVPRLLFPFVRRLIGDTVRDGGFPPLMPDMPDFLQMYYRQRQEKAEAQAGEGNDDQALTA